MKTPEQIARYAFSGADNSSLTVAIAKRIAQEAIEADRAQRTPLEDWAHNVAALMADDKSNDWREEIARLMVITGEADDRIAELTAAWEDATGDTAADYVLSEDDWKAGLSDDEAAEIVALIEQQAENQKRAEHARIERRAEAERIAADILDDDGSDAAASIREMLTAAALAGMEAAS